MTDIKWTSATAKLGNLKPWDGNPKTSTGKQHAQLTNSFDELGQFQTVAISPTGDVYDGHQRLSALLAKHGKDYEVQALQSSRPLTDEERRKIAIYSRQIGAWDWDELSAWDAGELMKWGFDDDLLKDWGQDYSALSAMLESEEEAPEQGDAEPQTNRADELREEWSVELGQMWRLPSRTEGQEHRLICGDCTDKAVVARVMCGEKAELGMHDPPYGIDAATMTLGIGKRDFIREDFDKSTVDINHLIGASKNVAIWGGNYYTSKLPENNDWLCWDKKNPNLGYSEFELAWTNFGKNTRIINHHWSGEDKLHPTMKPLPVIAWALSFLEWMICIDFYSGSGTTIIAAENLSRQCRAVEISPAYVAVALQRYQDAFNITPELID